jgi:3-hydroxyisobutyrate dehydrogenase
MPDQTKIAVIGLGSMGAGMARSLLRAGHIVTGCDLSDIARKRLDDEGGAAFATPVEAARDADIAIVVVLNDAQTEAVLFGENGAVAAMQPGSVVISSATMPPASAKAFAERAAQSGVLYLDAPISGGSVKADAGTLTIMASGSPEAFRAARPALDAMAETVYELGDDVGTGAAFKIVNQLLAGVHIAAACEAITFAKKLGLDIDRVFEVITKSAGNSWMFENRIPHVLAGDYTPHSAVSIFTKDLGIVSELGRKEKFPLPTASSALQLFIMAEAAGMGQDDDASVARLLAGIAGIELPSK